MTDFIIAYLHIMFSGPQEFCICCVPFGLVMPFVKKISDYVAYDPPPRNARKQAKTAKAAKPKQKQKKAKPEKQKPWYVAPPMSPHEHAEYAKYYAKSRGIKASEAGEWSIPD